jgi:hypothetical protein
MSELESTGNGQMLTCCIFMWLLASALVNLRGQIEFVLMFVQQAANLL